MGNIWLYRELIENHGEKKIVIFFIQSYNYSFLSTKIVHGTGS